MDKFKLIFKWELKLVLRCLLITLTLFFVLIFVFESCDSVKYDQQFDSVSPSGNKKVTVKYDYVSRPDVYHNGDCIFEYSKSGFNETVFWNVEWLSEDEIKLYLTGYEDEEYIIAVP